MLQQCFVKKTILSFNSSLNSSKSFIVIAPSFKSETILERHSERLMLSNFNSIIPFASKNIYAISDIFTLGHPIGASSIPVGKGISKGNSVLLCLGCSEGIVFPFDRKNPKKPAVSWHTIFRRKV